MSFFKNLLNDVKAFAGNVAEGAVSVGGKVVDGAVSVGGKVADTVSDAAESVAENVSAAYHKFSGTDDAKQKLIAALEAATKDDNISAEELAEIENLRGSLKIDDAEWTTIRKGVLKNVLVRVAADGQISAAEDALVKRLSGELPADAAAEFQAEIAKLETLPKV